MPVPAVYSAIMGLLATYLDGEALLLQVIEYKLLKKDVFGQISLVSEMDNPVILRDASCASAWVRPSARWLVSREARALAVLDFQLAWLTCRFFTDTVWPEF
jgi:hypothetical protein